MKKFSHLIVCISFIILIVFTGCKGKVQSEENASEKTNASDITSPELYAQIDSVFQIDENSYHVYAAQFDITEREKAKGDTLQRPVYSCTVRIKDSNNKVLFADSFLRDSWGYKGKILPIEAYQLTFPQFSREGNEIVFMFNIFEDQQNDAIAGFVAFDVKKKTPNYYWKEAPMGE